MRRTKRVQGLLLAGSLAFVLLMTLVWATPVRLSSATPTPRYRVRLPLILRLHPPPTRTPTPTATATLPSALDVPLTVRDQVGTARDGEPVTSGVPIPATANLRDLTRLRLLDAAGRPVAAQFTALARWGGGPGDAAAPVRWLLVDFQASVPAGGTATFRLRDSGGASPTFPTLSVSENASAVTINTGVAIFTVSKADGSLNGPGLATPWRAQLRSPDSASITYALDSVRIVLRGPLRAVVHVKGIYRDSRGQELLRDTRRCWFYAGQPYVRLFTTLENRRLCPLGEYEQLECFDIGTGGSVNVDDFSLTARLSPGSFHYYAGTEGAPASGNLSDRLLLYQDSSGNEQWNLYPTFTDWDGNPLDARPRMQSYVQFRGYRLSLGGATLGSGNHAPGWLILAAGNSGWTVAVRDFWQSFPKALRAATDGSLEIGLFPAEFGPTGYAFNLRAGEDKTHEMLLYAHVGGVSLPSLAAAFSAPLFAEAAAAWYVGSGALGPMALRNASAWPDYEEYINYQLDTSPAYDEGVMDWFPNLPTALQRTDFYGIFDYGDVPIDYEGRGVSPLNMKYNMEYGMWLQWARGGDRRWFQLAEVGGRHIADIDVLHNLHTPRHWGDGVMFGHSEHDELGFTNPHRNANSGHPDMVFGVHGLLLTYYLTGYEKAYDTAIEIADCIEYRLRNDAQLCTYFPGDCNGMGYVLEEGLYGTVCRPAANSLRVAVEAYRATGDRRYLRVADALVHWGRASVQPYIHGPTGADAQVPPWTLNMYLNALARYLEMRREFGLSDTQGARESFLAYTDFLRRYAWLDLSPIDTGPRGAYPHEWWFDGRAENREPDINNWSLAGADALAYAYYLSGEADYLERATRLFRTGTRDPWFEGDANTYSATKELANSVTFGHIYLWLQARQ